MADTAVAALAASDALTGVELFYADGLASAAAADVKVTATQIKTFCVGAGSVSVASGKTLTASNTLTLAGTDSTTMTFPSTSATIARTDAGQTFTGTNIFGIVQGTSLALGGATIGSNALAVTGTANISGNVTTVASLLTGNGALVVAESTGATIMYNGGKFAWSSSAGVNLSITTFDTNVSRNAAGVVQAGTTAANSAGIFLAAAHQTTDTTVASLPAAAAGNKGQRRHVTDANATTFATTVAGGGANIVPVFSDGTNWIIG